MLLIEKQTYYNNLKKARDHHRELGNQYTEIASLLDVVLEKIDVSLLHDKTVLDINNQTMCNKLKNQTLETRRSFIELNKFNDSDLEFLSGALAGESSFNAPTLELFPGSGQFLEFALAAEPLYIADRFTEICDSAAENLKNDFYVNRRLRKYKIDYFSLRNLPQGVFKLVYCFNEFFFADEKYILAWSNLVYNLVTVGGKFVFNFLPNDEPWSIGHNQRFEFSTINQQKLIVELEKQGWELEQYAIRQTKASYIKVKKTGIPEERLKISGGVAEIIDL